MNEIEKPVIAITMGDAAGIGPEVIVKALQSKFIHEICQPLVVGEAAIMKKTIEMINKNIKLHCINGTEGINTTPSFINLIDLQNLESNDVITGKICSACGKAAMEFIQHAADLVLADKAKALVTTPINKKATKLAGYGDIGHLEFLAHLTKSRNYATMLVSGPLRVVHLTTHFSLKEACNLVTKERIFSLIKLTNQSFEKWGIKNAHIAVAALNPHGGEEGLFGREEIEEILPAIEDAISIGIEASGPFPADSIFNRAIKGEFDVVIALYHDQGHIPIKVYGVENSVSIALGLPFIRTSVDHGTAFDIAGKGIADAHSLEQAIIMAVALCKKGELITTK